MSVNALHSMLLNQTVANIICYYLLSKILLISIHRVLLIFYIILTHSVR